MSHVASRVKAAKRRGKSGKANTRKVVRRSHGGAARRVKPKDRAKAASTLERRGGDVEGSRRVEVAGLVSAGKPAPIGGAQGAARERSTIPPPLPVPIATFNI